MPGGRWRSARPACRWCSWCLPRFYLRRGVCGDLVTVRKKSGPGGDGPADQGQQCITLGRFRESSCSLSCCSSRGRRSTRAATHGDAPSVCMTDHRSGTGALPPTRPTHHRGLPGGRDSPTAELQAALRSARPAGRLRQTYGPPPTRDPGLWTPFTAARLPARSPLDARGIPHPGDIRDGGSARVVTTVTVLDRQPRTSSLSALR